MNKSVGEILQDAPSGFYKWYWHVYYVPVGVNHMYDGYAPFKWLAQLQLNSALRYWNSRNVG